MAAPATAFDDATLLATAYLRPLLDPVHVGTRVPRPRLPEMVLLRRVGGPRRNALIEDARIDVQVWAASDERAMEIARHARYELARICEREPRVRQFAEESGPQMIPDAPSDVPRVLMTVVLSVRGAVPT
ncbi:hypothetical protein RM844_30345 [Streptomyces sp. DSM 44915]|uniref:DUF3168 domain-containing protein n=1 Tax=Streptomyces chisholmiae TaxID=3075540 RepID=A0ABU2K017_9ACTN|nr:hypothetical protein [Streptomyces sp. DSM 44915]MDT0270582.1 hypothetical protein [Streptomyces sp. DSM 44915]